MQILSTTVRGMARPPGRGDLSTVMPRFITNLGLSTSYFRANRKFSCTVGLPDNAMKVGGPDNDINEPQRKVR